MKLMNFMKDETPFKTIQSYFLLNENIFCNFSSSSILLLTYNLQVPFPISVQSECPWVKSWNQINFFHYKSVLSSFSSVPVLVKKPLFSGPNEYHTFYLYLVLTSSPLLLLLCDNNTTGPTAFMLPFASFRSPSNLHFSSSICLPPPGPKSVLKLYSFIYSITLCV